MLCIQNTVQNESSVPTYQPHQILTLVKFASDAAKGLICDPP